LPQFIIDLLLQSHLASQRGKVMDFLNDVELERTLAICFFGFIVCALATAVGYFAPPTNTDNKTDTTCCKK
jgi:hypothetical protein